MARSRNRDDARRMTVLQLTRDQAEAAQDPAPIGFVYHVDAAAVADAIVERLLVGRTVRLPI
jgi:hypothetical protein